LTYFTAFGWFLAVITKGAPFGNRNAIFRTVRLKAAFVVNSMSYDRRRLTAILQTQNIKKNGSLPRTQLNV